MRQYIATFDIVARNVHLMNKTWMVTGGDFELQLLSVGVPYCSIEGFRGFSFNCYFLSGISNILLVRWYLFCLLVSVVRWRITIRCHAVLPCYSAFAVKRSSFEHFSSSMPAMSLWYICVISVLFLCTFFFFCCFILPCVCRIDPPVILYRVSCARQHFYACFCRIGHCVVCYLVSVFFRSHSGRCNISLVPSE